MLIYCGMSGREFDKAVAYAKVKFGLVTRLASHASGRLSGDQLCAYAAKRNIRATAGPAQDDQQRQRNPELDLRKRSSQ